VGADERSSSLTSDTRGKGPREACSKHHQATFEEFHATRPSLRWRHLVAAVQAAAISHGRIQDVYDHAIEVLHA